MIGDKMEDDARRLCQDISHTVQSCKESLKPSDATPDHHRSACCEGEICHCGNIAGHKVEEVIFPDDPMPDRHPLTTYLCSCCFARIMGL